ncbi:MAG TPA: glycerol-3-phosphate dehydrogenase/oxidase [Anaerolineae bacterium]|jgi:glycerol-3-phosphate dehydrogenase|nr:glycerol-3-phosphate dehydrogenase/oxidase [Anaerolineae bacterium]
MWQQGWRDQVWAGLDQEWDIIIIGGGITGAGVFREAVRAGQRALLIEAQDFAAGTSSRSSKLVHGGLRYLRNGQISTTISSVHERERLLREGRGLVTPLGFLYAGFSGDVTPLWALGLGLAIYDFLGLRWGHKRYDPQSLAALAPSLRTTDLAGGYRYFDAQTDDARLVLRLIREAVRAGGQAINYVSAQQVLRQKDGRVCGVALTDVSGQASRRTAEAMAPVVVNATGAWADHFRIQIGGRKRLRNLRGSHLVFPAEKLPLARAVSFAHPLDGRPIFALPWEGVTLFGTTDVDHSGMGSREPRIDSAELEYLMSAVEFGFPSLGLDEGDIQSTFAGVRAVVDTGKADPSKESREHVLWSENGLLTVTGGKLTTFRVMARDALRAVKKSGGRKPKLGNSQALDTLVDLEPLSSLDPALKARLAGRYGQESPDLVRAAAKGDLSPVDERVGHTALWAELRWAARAEGVVHLGDLLLRRVRLGLLLPRGGLDQMASIRAFVQPELGWDNRRWSAELAAYTRQWHNYYGPPGASCPETEPSRPHPIMEGGAL